MKLKRLPEDFCVEELTDFQYRGGPFSFYRLDKTGIGTPEAIQAILRGWNLRREQISYGGLKDRHAVTTQFVTIFSGPKQNFEDRSLRLEFLGHAGRAFGPHDIRSNRFHITLRGIPQDQIPQFRERLEQLANGGIVNYFDDQRFGSLGTSGQFIAHAWCRVDYERTLFLAMAEPNAHDRPREREQKEILRECWGKWIECKERLDRSHRRSIVTYLVDHPTDFKRAVALIRADLRSIYVAAFQSFLWNRWLSDLLQSWLREDQQTILPSACGPLIAPRNLDKDQAERLSHLALPLPSARQREWDSAMKPALDKILQSLEMDTHQVRLKYPRDTFFSKGTRAAWLSAADLTYSFARDDLDPKRQKLQLDFSLPRGSYATMIVKWIDHRSENDSEAAVDSNPDLARWDEPERGEVDGRLQSDS